ncbi:hypothetical protein [Desertivirga brevis]|uniref:hypothetical protein n=1 Tax=Desertivirga brevis TaxID=2810310 RepID=UPI001A95EBFB|nr:hypothetical protein [Pedobacter sp. SYSU D00873]
MKLLLLCFLLPCLGYSQVVIYDPGHFQIVNENGVSRFSAEITHNNYLRSVNRNLDDINLNMTAVILVQNMIRNSLTQIDQALRSGLAVRQLTMIGQEILAECEQMIQVARSSPHLLLFAEEAARQLKLRAVRLAAEVAEFIQKEGDQVMMDYHKRDELLRKIILEMKVIRALCFSIHRSVYWAAARGFIRSVNPFQHFINQDRRLAEEIIRNYKRLNSKL